MLKQARAKARHRRLMNAACHLIREASISSPTDPSRVTPDELAALAFARHQMAIDSAEAIQYLNAARVARGHRIEAAPSA